MIAVALTGGIGAGKSSVAALLSEKGAVILDLDVLARQVVESGTSGYLAVVEHFGSGILAPDGSIDRRALGDIVFDDAGERAALEAIVHPEVASVVAQRLAEEAATDHVVVVDIPLLAEAREPRSYLQPFVRGVLVVDSPLDLAVERLIRLRGLTKEEAQARIEAQATREERLRIADFVILNDGTMDELSAMTDRAWEWLLGLESPS